jgi:hypothetical protein
MASPGCNWQNRDCENSSGKMMLFLQEVNCKEKTGVRVHRGKQERYLHIKKKSTYWLIMFRLYLDPYLNKMLNTFEIENLSKLDIKKSLISVAMVTVL